MEEKDEMDKTNKTKEIEEAFRFPAVNFAFGTSI